MSAESARRTVRSHSSFDHSWSQPARRLDSRRIVSMRFPPTADGAPQRRNQPRRGRRRHPCRTSNRRSSDHRRDRRGPKRTPDRRCRAHGRYESASSTGLVGAQLRCSADRLRHPPRQSSFGRGDSALRCTCVQRLDRRCDGGTAVALLVLTWCSPGRALNSWTTGTIFCALVIGAVATLRAQTKREFPDANIRKAEDDPASKLLVE